MEVGCGTEKTLWLKIAKLEIPDEGTMTLLLSLPSSGSLYLHQKLTAVCMSLVFPMEALHLI